MPGDEKKTILVVDDMATILEHARQLLKETYRVVPCTSAIQALEIIPKVRPDLIMTDINMPEMDGYELLVKLKNSEEYKHIPVLLVTSELTADIETKGFDLGADDFVMKPFSLTILLKRIENNLSK